MVVIITIAPMTMLLLYTVVRGTEVSVSEANKRIPLIEDEAAEISIPREVLTGLGEREQVRVASLLFRNMTGFLPERLEENNRRLERASKLEVLSLVNNIMTDKVCDVRMT